MGFNFNFLKTAAKGAGKAAGATFSFLSNAVPGASIARDTQDRIQKVTRQIDSLPAPVRQQVLSNPEVNDAYQKTKTSVFNAPKNVAVDLARSIPRTGLRIGTSVSQALGSGVDTLNVSNPLAKAVLGNEPVKSYQKGYSENVQKAQQAGFGKASAPISLLGAGLAAGLDVTGFGGAEKALAKSTLEQLAKETTERGVQKILKDKLAPEVISKIAPAVAQAKDPNIIRNLIKGKSDVPVRAPVMVPKPAEAQPIQDIASATIPKVPKPPTVISRSPTESPELVDLVKRGKLQKAGETAPIDSLKLGSDTKGGYDTKQVSKYITDIKQGRTVDPIVIDNKGFVQDGKHRLEAMRQLGVKDVPVVQQIQVTKETGKPLLTSKVPTASTADPFEQIVGAINGKKGIGVKVSEQEKLLSQERGARFAKSAEAGKSALGSQGYFAEKSALKGSYGKVDFQPLVHDIGPEKAEELFTAARSKINSTGDEVYQELGLHPQAARLNTQTAVRKVLGLEPGLPTRSELKLLRVYSPKLAAEAEARVPVGRKIFDAAATIFGSARSAKSTLDLSMGGRQGLFVAARHPFEWARANKESIKFAKSTEYYNKTMKKVHGDEWGKLIDKYNPSVLTGGASHEEAYVASDVLTSKAAKKIGVGHLVAGAERAYTGGLTVLRKPIIVKALKAYGATAEEAEKALGPKGVQGLIEAVSTLTGRGGKVGGFVSKHATTLQEALFSPRLWASRLQPLNPAFWKRIGPAGRKEAMQSLGAFAAVAGTVLGAAVAAGADVETNPRSSDFLKIKVGDTRYDILGGFQQNLVFGARQLTGETKSSQSGRVTKYGEGFGAPTRLSATFDLVRNKANPIIASGANILEGKDKAGNQINPATEIGQLFVPISLQNTFNARNNPKEILKGLPDIVGVGSQTYGLKDIKVSDKQQTIINKLTDKNQQQAYTRFFQTVKTGPDRNKAGEDIKAALTNNDVEKAKQIAKDYNNKYKTNFSNWRKQYDQYKTDKALLKEYNSNLITSDTLKRYVSTIKKGE